MLRFCRFTIQFSEKSVPQRKRSLTCTSSHVHLRSWISLPIFPDVLGLLKQSRKSSCTCAKRHQVLRIYTRWRYQAITWPTEASCYRARVGDSRQVRGLVQTVRS